MLWFVVIMKANENPGFLVPGSLWSPRSGQVGVRPGRFLGEVTANLNAGAAGLPRCLGQSVESRGVPVGLPVGVPVESGKGPRTVPIWPRRGIAVGLPWDCRGIAVGLPWGARTFV